MPSEREDISPGEGRRWLSLASRVAAFLWDDESWDVLSARFLQLARDAGALSVLPLALTHARGWKCSRGGSAVVSSLLDEVAAVNAATGAILAPYVGLARAAFQGREAEAAQADRDRHERAHASGRGTGADIHSMGDRRAPQRPGPLRGGARRGAAGRRGHLPLVVAQLGVGRADRGGRPEREGRARGRRARPAFGDDRGQWHRLGARGSRPARERC